MKSLRNAFRFINASFKLAASHPQLRKTWLILAAGGLSLLILWFLPIGAVAGLIGFSPLGLMLIGSAGVFFIASLCLWGEIAGVKLCQSAGEAISENPEVFSTPPNLISAHGGDILLYALSLPVLSLTQAANKTQYTWLPGKALMVPIISLEDRSLKEALNRVAQITRENLLRFKPGLVPVTLIARILQAILILCGVLLGIIAAQSIHSIEPAPNFWPRLLSVAAGMALVWLMTIIGTLFSTYVRSCYHTALYIWVRNVEKSRNHPDTQKAEPPKIIQHVLGTAGFSKKERKNGPKKRDPHLE